MKNIKLYIAYLFLSLITISCEEVVDIDLDTAEPKLVIDASIKWEKETDGRTQMIKLTTSTDYYATTIPNATGAVVTVTNISNDIPKTYLFVDTANNGEYVCNDFECIIGDEYELNIIYKGQNYTGTSVFTSTPAIEKIEQITKPGFDGEDFIQIKFYFQDNGDEVNYYLGGVKNSTIAFPEYGVITDEFTQGNLMFLSYQDDLVKDDIVDYSLQGITKSYSDYMNKLIGLSGAEGGGPFSTAPATIRGNVINTTDSENYPFGYFQLSETDSGSYIVE